MKKVIITASVLAVIAVGSLSAFFIVKNKQDIKQQTEIEKANENILFSFNSDNVTGVDFECPDGEFIAEHNGESWHFTNTNEISPNQDYIINVVSYMSNLTAEKSYGDLQDTDPSRYGLDSPRTITCHTDEKDYTIYMGSPTPTNEAFYCMVEGRDKIYSIDYSYGSVLYTSLDLLRTKNFIGLSDNEFQEIEIIRNGESIYTTKKGEDNIWKFDGEYSNLQLDSTKVTAMISVLTRLKAEEFVELKLTDYSKYNFDEPYAKMRFKDTSGKEHSYLFSKYGEDTDYIYVLSENSGEVSKYYTADLYYIENNPIDVVVNQIYSTYISTVNSLDINYKGEEIHLDIDQENSKYIVNGTDISNMDESLEANLFSMYNALSNIKFSEIDKNAEISGEPVITIEYHLDEDINTIMEFIPRDEDSYWLRINDTDTEFIISDASISGDYSFMYWYRKLTTAIEEALL